LKVASDVDLDCNYRSEKTVYETSKLEYNVEFWAVAGHTIAMEIDHDSLSAVEVLFYSNSSLCFHITKTPTLSDHSL
jgi:hypothetical protein